MVCACVWTSGGGGTEHSEEMENREHVTLSMWLYFHVNSRSIKTIISIYTHRHFHQLYTQTFHKEE